MLDIFAKIGLINFLVSIFLGIQIILRKRNIPNAAFSLLAFSIAFWSFGYWRWLISVTQTEALLWVKIFTIGSILIPIFYFLWILVLLGVTGKYAKTSIFLVFVSLTLIFNTFFTDLVVSGVQGKLIFPFWPIPGSLYLFYVLFIYLGLVSWALIILWNYKTDDISKKYQIRYIFWGSLIGFGGGISNFFLWYGILIPPYLNFLVGIGLILFYYAASKNNLFNAKVIATEFFTYLLGMAMVVRLIFAAGIKDRIVDGLVLVLIAIVGVQLIKSVQKEVEQREKLEILTKELEKANEKLKELDHLKSEFLSFASHQIKAPLAAIKGFASLIFDGTYGEVPEKAREAAVKIKDSADRMVQLVSDFLNLRKIEEGRMEYKFEKTNAVKIVQDIFEEFKPLAQKKNLEFNLESSSGENWINADTQSIRQVFQNLIENSIKYTDAGFVKIETGSDAGRFSFSVSDSGHGISKELLSHLFEEFKRDVKEKQIEGTGLGLYIAHEIVTAHRGEIWAESDGSGKGSKFVVRIPLL